MKNYLLLLTIVTSPLAAMKLSSLKPTFMFNYELFELASQTDATREQIDELIDGGAQVNARDWYGETALIKTAKRGNSEVCEALIKRGAKIGQTSEAFWLPPFMSISFEPLHYAVSFGNLNTVEVLVKCGADIFSCQSQSSFESPLQYCIKTWSGQFVIRGLTIAKRNQIIQDGSIRKIYETLIKHAWALPITRNLDASLKHIVTTFLSLKNWKVNGRKLPKGVIYFILQSSQELRDHLCFLVLPSVRQSKKIHPRYKRMVAQAIYIATLKEIQEHFQRLRVNRDRFKAKPELLELEFGKHIKDNILVRISNPL